jgi:hypothetical protein
MSVHPAAKSSAGVILMPTAVQIDENLRGVDNIEGPTSVRVPHDLKAWPGGEHDKVLENLVLSVHVEVDSHDLIRSVALNLQLWMAVTYFVSHLKQRAQLLIAVLRNRIKVCIQ